MPTCKNNGTCNNTTGKCTCKNGYTGDDCSISPSISPKCPTCKNNGTCNTTTGKCTCKNGYTGDDCSISPSISPKCPTCKNNGTCNTTTGKCTCKNGYTGDDCSNPRICDTTMNLKYALTYNKDTKCCSEPNRLDQPTKKGDIVCGTINLKNETKYEKCTYDPDSNIDTSSFNKDYNETPICGAKCNKGLGGDDCTEHLCPKNSALYKYNKDTNCCSVNELKSGDVKDDDTVCIPVKNGEYQILKTCLYRSDVDDTFSYQNTDKEDLICKNNDMNYCTNLVDDTNSYTWNGKCCDTTDTGPSTFTSGDIYCTDLKFGSGDDTYHTTQPCVYHNFKINPEIYNNPKPLDFDCIISKTNDIPICPADVPTSSIYKLDTTKNWATDNKYLPDGCCSETTKDNDKNGIHYGEIVCVGVENTNDKLKTPCIYTGGYPRKVDKYITSSSAYKQYKFSSNADSSCNTTQNFGNHATEYPWCNNETLYTAARSCVCDTENLTLVSNPKPHTLAIEKSNSGEQNICEVKPTGAPNDTRQKTILQKCEKKFPCACNNNHGGYWGSYWNCRESACTKNSAYCGFCTGDKSNSTFSSHSPVC